MRDRPVWGQARMGSKQGDWWRRPAEEPGNAGTGCAERGGHTQKAPCVGKGTEPGLGRLGWGTVRQQRSHGDACGLVEDHQAQAVLQ